MRFLIALAQTFGLLGVVALAFLDSSLLFALPGINDIALISFVVVKKSWLWAIVTVSGATVGSTLGAMLTYRIGHHGGRQLLHKRVPERFLRHILRWTARFGALPVGMAALLPPPCPYAPFVLTAGVVQVPRRRFSLSVALGRGLRYSLEAILAMELGRRLLGHLHRWYWLALRYTAAILLAFAALYLVYYFTRNRRDPAPPVDEEFAPEPEEKKLAG